jgi:hypothetical protein
MTNNTPSLDDIFKLLQGMNNSMNDSFELLVGISKDTNCEVKIIKKDVKDIKETVTDLVEDFKNFKNETRDIEEKIILMTKQLGKVEDSVEKNQLDDYTDVCRSKYDNWDDYDDLTRKFLPVSEILYSQLQKFDNPDYSPVVLEMCRGFENELKLKIFSEFIKQYAMAHKDDLEEHLTNDQIYTYRNVFTGKDEVINTITGKFQRKISLYIDNLKKKKEKPLVFTLGEMNFILENVNKKPIREKSQLLTDFYTYLGGITNISDFLSFEYQKNISELIDEFRNKAAHPNFVDIKVMEDCRSKFPHDIDYLIDCLK